MSSALVHPSESLVADIDDQTQVSAPLTLDDSAHMSAKSSFHSETRTREPSASPAQPKSSIDASQLTVSKAEPSVQQPVDAQSRVSETVPATEPPSTVENTMPSSSSLPQPAETTALPSVTEPSPAVAPVSAVKQVSAAEPVPPTELSTSAEATPSTEPAPSAAPAPSAEPAPSEGPAPSVSNAAPAPLSEPPSTTEPSLPAKAGTESPPETVDISAAETATTAGPSTPPLPGSKTSPAQSTSPVKSSTAPKKKKKKKSSSTASPSSSSRSRGEPVGEEGPDLTPLPNEENIRGDGLQQWRQRAQNRRQLLGQAAKDAALLKTDLDAALLRVKDAEHAEATVNKGLLTARSVIAQKDRTVAELNTSSAIQRAELAKLTEEKRKTDKRLILLKTVSANLQEAREARDAAERKLEEANTNIGKLKASVLALTKEIESLDMIKQQLSRREVEVEELEGVRDKLLVDAKRDVAIAAGLGATGMLALRFALRLVLGGSKN